MEKEKYIRGVTHKSEVETLYRKTLVALSRLGPLPRITELHNGKVEYNYYQEKPSLNRKKFHDLIRNNSWMLNGN